MQVPPGITNLSSATPTTLSNVSVGDRVLVTGTVGDAPDSLHAVRVIVMKSAAIAETHAAEEAAWQRGGGGLVQTVDTANGTIVVMSGSAHPHCARPAHHHLSALLGRLGEV